MTSSLLKQRIGRLVHILHNHNELVIFPLPERVKHKFQGREREKVRKKERKRERKSWRRIEFCGREGRFSRVLQWGSLHWLQKDLWRVPLVVFPNWEKFVFFESKPPTATLQWILSGLIVSTSTISIRSRGPAVINTYRECARLGFENRESRWRVCTYRPRRYRKRKKELLTPDGTLDAAVTRNLYLRLPLPPIYI